MKKFLSILSAVILLCAALLLVHTFRRQSVTDTESAEIPSSQSENTSTRTEQPTRAGATDEIEQWADSVVRLEVYDDKGERIGVGSGFAAFEPAVLVTASHVIVNMKYIIATLDDGTTFRVYHAIDADEDADVAILELPGDANLKPLSCLETDPVRGETVTAIGSQFGLLNLVTVGNVCGRWETKQVNWILFTAPVSSGSSGGPLLNENGEVTGVITGTYDKGQNLNLAAPVARARALAD